MFCGNCGSQYNDGDPFCPMCGTPSGQVGGPANAPVAGAVEKKSNKALPIILGVVGAVVVVAIVAVLLTTVVGGGYKKAVKNYYTAFSKGDVKALTEATMPSDVAEEMIDDLYDMDLDEYYEYQQDIYDALWNGLEDEGKIKFSYEIKKAENVDKLDKMKKESKLNDVKDLDSFIDVMDDAYDDYGLDADKIKAAYYVESKWTLEVDGKKEANGAILQYVYKYNGKWYVTDGITYNDVTSDLDDDDFEDVIDDVNEAYWDFLEEVW